jgi:hypothetical protein
MAVQPQPASASQAEIVLWKTIENSPNPADFQSYLDQYPHGAFAVLAQRHLDEATAQAERERINQLAQLTWTDTSTGLMWARLEYEDPESSRLKNFDEAMQYCSSLRLLQHSDWRLPTADELQPISGTPTNWVAADVGDDKIIVGMLWTTTPGPKPGEHFKALGGKRFATRDSDRGAGGREEYPGGGHRSGVSHFASSAVSAPRSGGAIVLGKATAAILTQAPQ